MKKISYNGNENYNEEYYPFNEFLPTGMVQEYSRDLDRYENQQRDGNEFEEYKRKKRLEKLKKLKKLQKKKNVILQPAPFYSTLYNTPSDFSGLNTSPLEYYDGTITDSPDAITNPYNNTYQSASDRQVRLKVRAMIFDDFLQ